MWFVLPVLVAAGCGAWDRANEKDKPKQDNNPPVNPQLNAIYNQYRKQCDELTKSLIKPMEMVDCHPFTSSPDISSKDPKAAEKSMQTLKKRVDNKFCNVGFTCYFVDESRHTVGERTSTMCYDVKNAETNPAQAEKTDPANCE